MDFGKIIQQSNEVWQNIFVAYDLQLRLIIFEEMTRPIGPNFTKDIRANFGSCWMMGYVGHWLGS